MLVLLWIHSSMQVGYMFENFQIIWNLKNANLNGFNVGINNLHPMILIFSKNIEN